MVPHERSLVEKYKDSPFVLLGINFDPDPEQARRLNDKAGITWRSWWAGGDLKLPPALQANRLPSVYVLDREGTIRHANIYGADLDQAVAALLEE